MTIANSYIPHKLGFHTKYYNAYTMIYKTSNYINLDLYYFIAVMYIKIKKIK